MTTQQHTNNTHGAQQVPHYDSEPQVTVGIVSGQKIQFVLNHVYLANGDRVTGSQAVEFSEGAILWNGNLYRQLV